MGLRAWTGSDTSSCLRFTNFQAFWSIIYLYKIAFTWVRKLLLRIRGAHDKFGHFNICSHIFEDVCLNFIGLTCTFSYIPNKITDVLPFNLKENNIWFWQLCTDCCYIYLYRSQHGENIDNSIHDQDVSCRQSKTKCQVYVTTASDTVFFHIVKAIVFHLLGEFQSAVIWIKIKIKNEPQPKLCKIVIISIECMSIKLAVNFSPKYQLKCNSKITLWLFLKIENNFMA